jgi:hypothetical protein
MPKTMSKGGTKAGFSPEVNILTLAAYKRA